MAGRERGEHRGVEDGLQWPDRDIGDAVVCERLRVGALVDDAQQRDTEGDGRGVPAVSEDAGLEPALTEHPRRDDQQPAHTERETEQCEHDEGHGVGQHDLYVDRGDAERHQIIRCQRADAADGLAIDILTDLREIERGLDGPADHHRDHERGQHELRRQQLADRGHHGDRQSVHGEDQRHMPGERLERDAVDRGASGRGLEHRRQEGRLLGCRLRAVRGAGRDLALDPAAAARDVHQHQSAEHRAEDAERGEGEADAARGLPLRHGIGVGGRGAVAACEAGGQHDHELVAQVREHEGEQRRAHTQHHAVLHELRTEAIEERSAAATPSLARELGRAMPHQQRREEQRDQDAGIGAEQCGAVLGAAEGQQVVAARPEREADEAGDHRRGDQEA